MDPISHHVFSYDYHRFVLQDLVKEVPPQEVEPQKKFNLKGADKSEKSKKEKDQEKEQKKKRRPFTPD